MPDPVTRESRIENPEVVLAHWQDRLNILAHEVKEWVERAGWRTRIIEKPIDDRKLGRHIVPVLLVEKCSSRHAAETSLTRSFPQPLLHQLLT